nr:PorV/PorQ family protein [Elusimicrobiota bacterium]
GENLHKTQETPRTKTLWSLVLFVTVFLGSVGHATFFSKKDRGHHGPTVLQTGVGVRAAGLAESYVAVADDASALYWNPAGLDRVSTQEVLFMQGESFGGKTQDFLGYLLPFWARGERRTLGVGYSRLSVDSFDLMEEGQAVGRAQPSESTLGFSYAQVVGAVSAGATVKTVEQKLDDETAHTWAADMGVQGRSINERWAWGASALNMGPALPVDDTHVPLPLTLRLGAAYRFGDAKTKAPAGGVLLTGQIDLPDDDLAVGRVGVEYTKSFLSAWRVAVRSGWASRGVGTDSSQWSLGGGVDAGRFRINFAQVLKGPLGNETRADVAMGFGREPAAQVDRRQRLERGQNALSQGNLLEAQAEVDQILAVSPRHTPALRLAGDIREAYSDSIDPPTLFAQGRAAFERGNDDGAVAFFRKLLVVSPHYPEGKMWLDKAEKRADQKKMAQVEMSVKKAREKELAKLVNTAKEAQHRKEWATALARWRKVLVLDGSRADAKAGVADCRDSLFQQGEELQKKGDGVGALEIFGSLTVDEPGDKRAARRVAELQQTLARSRAAEGKKKYDEGVDAYTAGDFKRAQNLFRQALELQPQDAAVRQALERTESELKRNDKP